VRVQDPRCRNAGLSAAPPVAASAGPSVASSDGRVVRWTSGRISVTLHAQARPREFVGDGR